MILGKPPNPIITYSTSRMLLPGPVCGFSLFLAHDPATGQSEVTRSVSVWL